MPSATLSSKGQITIPKSVRDRLSLRTGDHIDFVFTDKGEVVVKPRRLSFELLAGVLHRPGQKAVTVEEMDRGIHRAVRERWMLKTRSARTR